ncbi:RNA polymerase sigma factor [Microbacterium gubbeenense]|uniref:RNA polymerase sigma factor n=2 Tax=Microbacterium gubbeenense TaxID=159896 RepID=UPI0004224F0A|nr:RNA polymerase sigma factor [Microbacterium gubbeenense]
MGTTRRDELVRALDDSDARAASRAAAALVESGEPDMALEALAERAAGSRAALDALVETLDASRVVHRFAGSMLLDRDAIDDVAQDTLISVVQSIASYRGGGRFTSWVHPIVRRRVADHLRRQRETSPLNEELLPSARMSSMIATRATVQQALADLPDLYRVPVVLRDVHGLSYAEVAERLELSLGTVKSQISRGRAMVAGMLTEDEDHS